MFEDRKKLYKKLEKSRDSKLLTYITGDRRGLETEIHSETIDYFVAHLDKIGVVKKITLFLYTRGGNTLAGWNIINLIRQYCDELEIIVPFKCQSTGTLMCLGAEKIIMTKQATLGPIDPSINTSLNPHIDGAPPHVRYPVSVEAINGFVEFAKNELGITSEKEKAQILLKLSDKIHPLVLGQVYRTRSQIQMLASRLLRAQLTDQDKIEEVISFLCSGSGSHDYTINRREAEKRLNLSIEKPDYPLYELIKATYDDISEELELTTSYDPNHILAGANEKDYLFKRALVESLPGGCHSFVSEGRIQRIIPPVGNGPHTIQDQRAFEGWRKIA